MIERGASWREDFGLEIYGPVRMFSTHPAKSNSGNIWSALLATAFNDGRTPTEEDLPTVLPRVEAYFDAMGFMEDSSGDIFENFLKQGMGARPMIVGYENQLVEFLIENAQAADLIRDRIRVLYPAPTIYASHPMIALDRRCERLIEGAVRSGGAGRSVDAPRISDRIDRRPERSGGYLGRQAAPGGRPGDPDAEREGDAGDHRGGAVRPVLVRPAR